MTPTLDTATEVPTEAGSTPLSMPEPGPAPDGNQNDSPRPGFRIPVWNGIFKHCRRMREAIWFFLYLIDKTTEEFDSADGSRTGSILGGMPCRDQDAASALGRSERTIRAWRNQLAKLGYIVQKRTPIGYVITLAKSKKWPTQPANSCQSDRQNPSVRSEESVDPYRQYSHSTKTKELPPIPQGEAFALPDWIPPQEWRAYLEMRQRIRKPATSHAMRLAVRTLEKLKANGDDPKAVLEQSILNSWQGLFQLRAEMARRKGGFSISDQTMEEIRGKGPIPD